MLRFISDYVSSALFMKRFCESANSLSYDDGSLWHFYASCGYFFLFYLKMN